MPTVTKYEFTEAEFDAAVEVWVAGFRKMYNEHMALYENLTADLVEYSVGKRYVKVFKRRVGSKGSSVSAFIDRTNGDVLKPAGWAAPARTARGNIFDPQKGLGMTNHYGPAYLR